MPRSVSALVVAAPLCLLLGMAISLATAVNADDAAPWQTTLGYLLALLLGAGPAISLIVQARRVPDRAGVVTGAVVTVIAALFAGIPLVNAATALSLTAWASLTPLTAAESSSTIPELRANAQQILAEATTGLPDLDQPTNASGIYVFECTLSNGIAGEKLVSGGEIYETSATQQDALAVVADGWRAAGYEVGEHDSYVELLDLDWLEYADASWEAAGEVWITIHTICVPS